MKRILGILLAILMIASFWFGLSFVFYIGGLGLVISILIPPCCGVVATLIIRLIDLIVNLMDW